MDKPLVSIIIPVYNAEQYIAETISSVLDQTWSNKEIIIIDDGSTDNSITVAQNFNAPCIKIFKQANKGASAARNKGLLEAKGEYIQFLDADDLLSPDKITEQINLLHDNSHKIAVCSTIHFKDGDDLSDCFPSPYEEAYLISIDPVHFLINLYGGYTGRGSMVTIHAWLTPRHIIDKTGPWNEYLSTGDDGEFFCRVLINSNGIIKTNGLSYYRKSKSHKTLSFLNDRKSFESAIKSIDLIRKDLKDLLNPIELHNCFYKTYKEHAIKCFPAYKDLSKYCLNSASSVFYSEKLNNYIVVGGPVINFITNYISWKLARYLQYLLRNAIFFNIIICLLAFTIALLS